jgi:hypothetical protein
MAQDLRLLNRQRAVAYQPRPRQRSREVFGVVSRPAYTQPPSGRVSNRKGSKG